NMYQLDFKILPLTKDIADKYSTEIIASLDLIPVVSKHTKEQLLSDKKNDRELFGKWDHSVIMLTQDDKYIGVAIGYERKSESNDQYPINCIYLNDFAVSKDFQKKGLGKLLLKNWLEHNRKVGMKILGGPVAFAIQTNGAAWNSHVQKLYINAGFKKIAEKVYDNRVDNVYLLNDLG
ncbi:MAG: GNAT family N-acetyltransferase, partial [Patescibacteria group bacterium]